VILPAPQRMAALIDGYREHHALGETELAQLPEAIGFRTLIGACRFARAVTDGRTEDQCPWNWQRYLMAEQVAERGSVAAEWAGGAGACAAAVRDGGRWPPVALDGLHQPRPGGGEA
jgi:hypothetical protein